jgi:hypothetical protein
MLIILIIGEKKTIRIWLEEIAPSSHALEPRKNYLAHTIKEIKDHQRMKKGGLAGKAHDIVSAIDPDAKTREGKPVAPEDAVTFSLFISLSI